MFLDLCVEYESALTYNKFPYLFQGMPNVLDIVQYLMSPDGVLHRTDSIA